MKIFAAPLRQAAHRHLRRLHQQEAHDRTALLGDVSQAPALPAGVFQRHQSQITRHLLAAVKAFRVAKYQYLHIAIDDHSRISFAAILPDQSHQSAIRFFLMARAHFNRFGITIRRVYSDNGSCYRHWLYRRPMLHLHLKQGFPRPYTPRTNGKAERFIQTALREWAYARTYQNSTEREEQLENWLHE